MGLSGVESILTGRHQWDYLHLWQPLPQFAASLASFYNMRHGDSFFVSSLDEIFFFAFPPNGFQNWTTLSHKEKRNHF